MDVLKESKPPVSVFWIIDNNVVGYESDRADGELVGDYIHPDVDHYDIWKKFHINEPYDAYPRGRVLFNTKIYKYVVVADKCIIDNNVYRELIKTYYNLPETTLFEVHEHYKCKNCL